MVCEKPPGDLAKFSASSYFVTNIFDKFFNLLNKHSFGDFREKKTIPVNQPQFVGENDSLAALKGSNYN